MVIHELKNYEAELGLMQSKRQAWERQSIDEYVVDRAKAREHPSDRDGDGRRDAKMPGRRPRRRRPRSANRARPSTAVAQPRVAVAPPQRHARQAAAAAPVALSRPPRHVAAAGRRRIANGAAPRERRRKSYNIPFPDRRLTRSAYEQVFLKLVSGGKLRVGDELYSPIGMKGWYHAIFRRESDGAERLLTIDQLLQKMNDWQ